MKKIGYSKINAQLFFELLLCSIDFKKEKTIKINLRSIENIKMISLCSITHLCSTMYWANNITSTLALLLKNNL